MPMKWKAGDKAPDDMPYWIESEQGYRIARQSIQTGLTYMAWAPLDRINPLGCWPGEGGGDLAKAACEKHLLESGRK